MKNKILIIPIGNIAVGKSFLTKEFIKKGFLSCSRDQLRYSIGSGEYIFSKETEPIIFSTNKFLFKQLILADKNIILDETNVRSSYRKYFISYAKNFGYKVIGIELPRLSKKECVDRRVKNKHGKFTRKVWEGVWEMFDKKYESPSIKEGFEEVIKILKKEFNAKKIVEEILK